LRVLAYVGLGANLGNAAATVRWAMGQLQWLPGTSRVEYSSLYRSDPVEASGPDFINAVAAIHTCLTAPGLLCELQHLEQLAGRERPYHHAPRTLDLDLLLYGDGRIDSADLTVPHPRLYRRAFVLLPLAEIAPQLVASWQLQAVRSQPVSLFEE